MRNRVTLAASAFVLVASTAAAQQGVGEAKAVVDVATASGQVRERPLTVGSAVYLGDRVSTDGGGEAQLLFDDGTRMVLGPNSSLVIDEFVFRSQAHESKFAVRADTGAFRFMSGDAPKDAYLIHTPAATIGVRGTVFDFTASRDQLDLLLLKKGDPGGGAVVCSPGAQCAKVDEVCDVVSAERGGEVDLTGGDAAAEKLQGRFPLAAAQQGLDDAFRAEGEETEACLALFAAAPGVQATAQGPAQPIPGQEIPKVALPASLVLLGIPLGFLGGGDDDDGTTTTTTTTSTTTTTTGTTGTQ